MPHTCTDICHTHILYRLNFFLKLKVGFDCQGNIKIVTWIRLGGEGAAGEIEANEIKEDIEEEQREERLSQGSVDFRPGICCFEWVLQPSPYCFTMYLGLPVHPSFSCACDSSIKGLSPFKHPWRLKLCTATRGPLALKGTRSKFCFCRITAHDMLL